MPSPLDWPPPWDHRIKRYLQIDGQGEAERRALKIWQEALRLAQPRYWHDIITIAAFLQIFEPHAKASQAVQRLLEGCHMVALMAVSLGPRVEERSRALLAQREAFGGFMLDRMGSYLAERCMSCLDRYVTEGLRAKGLAATRRYSPGYKDFSLEAQKVFVALAAKAISGIRLSPGNLLMPVKSITAIKGINSGY